MSNFSRDIQADFNTMVARLYDGRGPSRDAAGACRYRLNLQPDGLPCVVGALIPNEAYTKEMDKGDNTAIENNILILSFLGIEDFTANLSDTECRYYNLLVRMQKVHDFEPYWNGTQFTAYNTLCKIAADYNLKLSPEPKVSI